MKASAEERVLGTTHSKNTFILGNNGFFPYRKTNFIAVTTDLRNIHGVGKGGQCMKTSRRFRSQFVADLMNPLFEFRDEEGAMLVA